MSLSDSTFTKGDAPHARNERSAPKNPETDFIRLLRDDPCRQKSSSSSCENTSASAYLNFATAANPYQGISGIEESDPTMAKILNDAQNNMSPTGDSQLQQFVSTNYTNAANDSQLLNQSLSTAGFSSADGGQLWNVLQQDMPSVPASAPALTDSSADPASDTAPPASTTPSDTPSDTPSEANPAAAVVSSEATTPITTSPTDASSSAPTAPSEVTTPAATTTPTASSNFSVSNGQIIAPNGQAFIARGLNVNPSLALADESQILQSYPGLNMLRLNAVPSQDSPAEIQQVINDYTAKGIVVEVEDHTSSGNEGNNSNVVTGSDLTTEQNWYSQIAATNVNNPYVWFGTANEPNDPSNPQSVVDQESQTYQSIRATGNNNMIEMELNQGLYAAPMQADPAAYANMKNIAWDAHSYGWESNFSTDQNTVTQELDSLVQQAQTVQSADGIVPVVIGEYGNSGSDTSIAPNADQTINAVTQSGLGSDAWQWQQFGNPTSGPDADNDSLFDGSNVTPYGQQIGQYINQVNDSSP